MTQQQTPLITFYKGWDVYQQHIIKAIAPLSDDQLALRAAPHLRSIGEIATHIIGARARWFHGLMGEGGEDIASLTTWDRQGMPVRTADELVAALQTSWQLVENCLTRWQIDDLEYTYTGSYGNEPYTLTRQWVLWHLIEHDLHHGGEISLTLGIYGLEAPDL
ncbi:MAG TPA: DinB family protein [Ktedonobacteraceae bacterium]